MAVISARIPKPARWDVPFGPDMTDGDVDYVLSIAPFSEIDPARFGKATPLREIIRNDSRLVRYSPGDIIVRQGDYGSSLFFLINGRARVALDPLPQRVLGRSAPPRRGLMRSIAQLWTNHRTIEYRDAEKYAAAQTGAGRRGEGEQARVFLQDIPGVLDRHRTAVLESGSFFGELAALARTARAATVFAEDECEVLEIRWQGFRDIRKRADEIRAHVDRLYRERALTRHLESTPIFSHLKEKDLQEVADQVTFETYGDFDWFASFRKLPDRDPAKRLSHEPVIEAQGNYPNGLLMIRSGFVRVSRKLGDGEQTVSYLGKGQVYGFPEIAQAHDTSTAVPLRGTIRAVGYVDVLRVPTRVVEKYVLSGEHHGAVTAKVKDRLDPFRRIAESKGGVIDEDAPTGVETGMLEFLVENRFINGTSSMLIDLNRCTNCDDCVRACASAHDGNPRFIRHGKQYGHHMVANACMHCMDPVCMIGCPTGAIHRSESGGEVMINDETCIGCATCANSCPYQNIRMVEVRDETGQFIRDENTHAPIVKATKCDLSLDQLGDPPCQRACPHDALKRINMPHTRSLARYLNR